MSSVGTLTPGEVVAVSRHYPDWSLASGGGRSRPLMGLGQDVQAHGGRGRLQVSTVLQASDRSTGSCGGPGVDMTFRGCVASRHARDRRS